MSLTKNFYQKTSGPHRIYSQWQQLVTKCCFTIQNDHVWGSASQILVVRICWNLNDELTTITWNFVYSKAVSSFFIFYPISYSRKKLLPNCTAMSLVGSPAETKKSCPRDSLTPSSRPPEQIMFCSLLWPSERSSIMHPRLLVRDFCGKFSMCLAEFP